MAKIPVNPLILVDGSSYLYRAHYAYPPLANSTGKPTSAIYGVLNMLRNLILQYHPSHLAVIFDAKGKTFRDQLFIEYKSHRQPMPEKLYKQIEPLHKILKALGLPLLTVLGVEADDVIGTLAKSAEKYGRHVLISTNDKDMAQLVTPNITLLNTNNTILGPKEVFDKYGVPPELIIDLLSLMGDSSDNIPGVPTIGKKIAQTLLLEIGNLKEIYNNLDKIANLRFRGSKNISTQLKLYKYQAELSYLLATIKTNVTLEIDYHDLHRKQINTTELHKLFSLYEFKLSLEYTKKGLWLNNKNFLLKNKLSIVDIKKIPPILKETKPLLSQDQYIIILNYVELNDLVINLKAAKIFSCNTQTDSLDILTANLVSLSFATEFGMTAYIPLNYNDLKITVKLNRESVLAKLKPLLEDSSLLKVGHNLKHDHSVLARYGIEMRGMAFDTMLESYNLDSSSGQHDIYHLTKIYLKHNIITLKNFLEKENNHYNINKILSKNISSYKIKDPNITLQLHLTLWPQLKKEQSIKQVFTDIDIPLIPVLSRMERIGVLINSHILYNHSQELTVRLYNLEEKAYQAAGKVFNLSSPKQLQEILFKKQELSIIKKNIKGISSTNKEVLTKLAQQGLKLPIIILEYRSLAKLKSTYTDKLLNMVNPITQRVHTSYHQAVTITGRLSSSNPSLQNIPIHNYEGRRIRQAFIAPQNYKIVSADYSQIELRIMAHLSGDKSLLNAFATGKDIHSATAADVFGLKLEEVTSAQRQSAKTINFGLIYGMSAFGLARQLNIARVEAQRYINYYFNRYPKVLKYMENIRQQASNRGYVETLDGRRLYLPNIHSPNIMYRKGAERTAINAPIQGTAADLIKKAMITIDSWLIQQKKPLVHMIMQIHDELVFEVHESVIDHTIEKIQELMEQTIELTIPLKVKIGIGENWEQAH
ncbi:DNA polymerase I [Candidatus Profftia sp. (ex Adelges kitamiensis)]|uniref:DNA polymerase I n=1 Tax=Candidatus Profftia sp. (ex Adelges kitamiensis) TaxID=2864218 RepID=UPI001CE39EB0|nr:DNA polymerase I [Candidatus Profftia sp. (ex Adelges kitamiensis)]